MLVTFCNVNFGWNGFTCTLVTLVSKSGTSENQKNNQSYFEANMRFPSCMMVEAECLHNSKANEEKILGMGRFKHT